MFKIVETIEDEKKEFSCVPDCLEKNNILRWPNIICTNPRANNLQKILEKLKINGAMPEENWASLNCLVKARNLSYSDAICGLKKYASFLDTEDEER